jgi:hypothetical protein
MTQEFSWPVAKDYELRRVRRRLSGSDSLEWLISPVGPTKFTYAPLGKPRLFREFSEVPLGGDGSAYLKFARKYGLLGLEPHQGGELADGWTDELMTVWRSLRRFDALKGRRTGLSREMLIPFTADRSKRMLEAAEQLEKLRKLQNEALRDEVIKDVSDRIQMHQLMPRLAAVHVGKSVRFVLDHVPRTLIGTIWLQVSGALSGQQDFTRCENEACRRWLDLAPRRGRKVRRGRNDKRFCSDLCRATWHQAQKRRATKEADKLSG